MAHRLMRVPRGWLTGVPANTRVLLFAGVMALAGAGLLAITPAPTLDPDRAWELPFFGLVLAFAVAESTALHVEIRKESHSLSLSAIPLMFGALYMSPALLVLAYVVGSVPALRWIRGLSVVKTIWNACLFFAEAALVALIVRSFLGVELPQTVTEWLVPLGAVLAAELMSLAAVPLVIMTVDAKLRPGLFGTVGHSQIVATLAAAFTVIVAAASINDPRMLLYAALPVVGIGAVLRAGGSLSQRYEDLRQLHRFTRALANEHGVRAIDIGLGQVVEIMRARSAGLLTRDGDDATLRMLIDDHLEEVDAAPYARLLEELTTEGAVADVTRNDGSPSAARLLSSLDAERILATRVLDEVEQGCVLFVVDRLGMRREYTTEEVRLFGSLSETLSARLMNDYLVAELETQAQHDALTGLPNRLQFEIAITACLADRDQRGAVIMVDLDRFKQINDSLGHETGDRLLVEVAKRLSAATRVGDVVSRFGGDEFAMLLTRRAEESSSDLGQRIHQIHEALTAKVEFDGIMFEIAGSFGVVQWPEQGTDSTTLLQRADTAMYQAKRNQLDVVWYSTELDVDTPRRLDLYLSAQSVLDREELFLHLQPKVSLVTGEISGAEALVRWTHPVHGNVSPAEFVPVIEQAGLIRKLTRFVLGRAAYSASTFRDVGLDVPIAVNLSARDLLDPQLPKDLVRILDEHGVDPSALEVEITETAMVVDFDTSVMVLSDLRELGVRVSIDDFGTGYSSLQHLHRLPADALKIDRSFVDTMATDDRAHSIVRASIGVAHDIGLATIAEGVEDRHCVEQLAELGCDEIQGYFLSRPLPIGQFLRWANEWQPASLTGGKAQPNPRGGLADAA